MKEINQIIGVLLVFLMCFCSINSFAGNEQRAGQAGASELLINPWARTSGWAGANVAGVNGVEGIFSNVAGLAFTEKTELIFTQTSWLQYGSKMFDANSSVSSISTFGFAQKVGEEAVETVIEAVAEREDLFMEEAADLFFHYLILLKSKGKSLKDIGAVLNKRKG